MKVVLLKKEDIVGKGEIAHDEQFILFLQCFKKSSSAVASKKVCMLESFNSLLEPYLVIWSLVKPSWWHFFNVRPLYVKRKRLFWPHVSTMVLFYILGQ